MVGEGGSFNGTIRVDTADVHGTLRGDVSVRNLLTISASGDVEGEIAYGQLALAAGSNLVADLKNVPPEMGGDFEIEVVRGGSVKITQEDLHATDAEDGASALTYTAMNLLNGHLALTDMPQQSIESFTQADIDAGNILFVHGGGETMNAGFDVVVVDSQGASAGPPRPVLVKVAAPAAPAPAA